MTKRILKSALKFTVFRLKKPQGVDQPILIKPDIKMQNDKRFAHSARANRSKVDVTCLCFFIVCDPHLSAFPLLVAVERAAKPQLPAADAGFFFAASTIFSTSASSFLASYTMPSLIVYLMPPMRSGVLVWSFNRIVPVP